MAAEPISEIRCELGEGPIWHARRKLLYFTDIDGRRVYAHNPVNGRTDLVLSGTRVGGIVVAEGGHLLLFGDKGQISTLDAEGATPIVESIDGEADARFNDVVVDPGGRVFCGTMSLVGGVGHLYRLDTDRSLRRVVFDIGCSNGMGFSPDGKTMYFVDSPTRCVDAFDYDEATGDIENRRVFARVPEEDGTPDGMTVDAEGCVWAALWGGYGVVRFDPNGVEMRRAVVPARNVTSLAFGGEDYATAYVTSSGAGLGGADGRTFRIDLGVKGKPEFLARIR